MWWWLAFAAVLLGRANSTLLTKSRIETCDTDGLSRNSCTQKLVILYDVKNGQKHTDSINLIVDKVENAPGGSSSIENKHISLVFDKTPVYFRYPTTYFRSYNYQPYEILSYGTSDGEGTFTPFNINPLTPPILECNDHEKDENPTCGWAYGTDNQKIPFSQGRCCKCQFSQTVLQLDNKDHTRGLLDCQPLSKKQQSAHCLRMDPLYYHAYIVGTASNWYIIQLTVNKCDKSNPNNCQKPIILTLNPKQLTARSPDGNVFAELIGDLAAFEEAPSFASKYLVVPAGTDKSDCVGEQFDPRRSSIDLKERCVRRVRGGPESWMLLDRYRFQGIGDSNCNSFSVDYQSFRQQSNFCSQIIDSCTQDQIHDFFVEDQKKARAGLQGKYWVSFQGSLGLSGISLPDTHGRERMQTRVSSILEFMTTRTQTTLVRVEVNADDLVFNRHVAGGEIVKYKLQTFEDNSNNGQLNITIKNTAVKPDGTSTGQFAQFFVGIVNCSEGILTPPALIASLKSGSTKSLNFNIKAQFTIGREYKGDHTCMAKLTDAIGEVVDTKLIEFKTTKTVVRYVPGQKGHVTAAPVGDGTKLVVADGGSGICHCSLFNFVCYITSWSDCMATVLVLAGIAAAIVLLILCFCIMFKILGPKICCKLLCCPFKCMVKMCRCCCKTLPECCRACADEKNPQDREMIRKYDQRLRRLENAGPDQRVMPTNRGIHMEQEPATLQQKSATLQQKSATRGIQSGHKFDNPQRLKKLTDCPVIYFNVPGLQSEQANFIRMKPNVPFSLAGVLTKTREENNYLFKIPGCHRRQSHVCNLIGGRQKLQGNQGMDLDMDYFSAQMPGYVANYFMSEKPRYPCVNHPAECQSSS